METVQKTIWYFPADQAISVQMYKVLRRCWKWTHLAFALISRRPYSDPSIQKARVQITLFLVLWC